MQHKPMLQALCMWSWALSVAECCILTQQQVMLFVDIKALQLSEGREQVQHRLGETAWCHRNLEGQTSLGSHAHPLCINTVTC